MTTPKNDGGPAFPTSLTGKWAGTGKDAVFAPDMTDGMSLRDWFAGMALQGMCANSDVSKTMSEVGMNSKERRESYVLSAWLMADAMLAEREKGRQ